MKIATLAESGHDQPTRLSRARIARYDDVGRALEVDRIIFRSAQNRLLPTTLRSCMNKSPDNIFVLEDQRGEVHGRALCLPMKLSILGRLKEGTYSPGYSDLEKDVLSVDEASRNLPSSGGHGNLVYVSMAAFNPSTSKESYACAIPLFLMILRSFYALHMRALIAHSRTETARAVLERAGAELMRKLRKTSDGPGFLAFFDGSIAARNVPSGLSVVYYTIWAVHTSLGLLNLSPRERALLDAVAFEPKQDATTKELAKRFGISPETAADHRKSIFRKGKDAGVFSPDGCTWAEAVRYYLTHPEEHSAAPGADRS